MQAREKDERRDWIIIFLIILFGLMCILLAGGWALRITPSWSLNSNMESNIDPNSDFLTARPSGFLEPLDPSILTQPVWMGEFLTPGASFKTGTPFPTTVKNTQPPPATQTPVPTLTLNPTLTRTNTPVIINPTNTSVVIPPATPTRTWTPSLTPVTSADLSITLTDGSATYTVGGTLTYTIIVRNAAGPFAVTGATVTDTFPAVLSGVTWTCTGSAGGTCPANGTGDINHTVNLPIGSFVTYTVNANISAAATGNLVNSATVTPPVTVADPVPANNTATDTDTPIFNVDLQITKTDGVAIYTPGTSTTYTIVVTNPGIANATGATITDIFPAGVSGVAWSCVSAGGATCTALGSGNIGDTVNIPVGGTLTYTAVASIASSATGNLTNSVTVAAPGGYTDTNPGNNTASDTDAPTPSANLQISKTDNATDYLASSGKTYTITVSNTGPSDATGATVSDILSTNPNIDFASVSWSCAVSGTATCTAFGVGDINDTVNLSAGSSITYSVVFTVSAAPTGTLNNTATVTAPVGLPDPAPGNETATDSDQLIVPDPIPFGNIDPDKNSTIQVLPPNGVTTLQLASPLVVGSHAGVDLIYYEWAQGANPGILMDRVIIQVGDGNNWYTILNWGDGAANPNTNISAPPGCAGEPDNCVIDATQLTNLTGVTFDLDGLVPNGTYLYIRIISPAPPIDSGDGVEVDALYVVP